MKHISELTIDHMDIQFVPKSWGYEKWIVNSDRYCGKILHINKGHCSSYHYHKIKDETFCVLQGKMLLELHHSKRVMDKDDTLRLMPGTNHRLVALEDLDVLEISTQHFDSDSIRLIDSDRLDISIDTVDGYHVL